MSLIRTMQLLYFSGLIFAGFSSVEFALPWMLLLAAALGLRAVSSRHVCQNYAFSKLMLVYLVWLFVVAYSSRVPNTSMMMLVIFAGLPVMYLVASNLQGLAEIWGKFSIALLLMGVVFASLAIWQVVFQIGTGHAVGPMVDRNAFAALLNLLWFPAVYLFLDSKFKERRWLRPLQGLGLFAISVALFATASRGGIATWLLLMPIVLWAAFRYTKSWRLVASIPLIALLAYICSAIFLQSDVASRNFDLSQDTATSARLLLWQSSIKMAMAHPFVGTGWGTFGNYYPAFREQIESTSAGFFAHNDYLQLAAEGGILALLLQLGLLLVVLLQLKHVLKRASDAAGMESIALLLGVLALFIHAGINFIFYFAPMNILAGLFLARAAQLTDVPNNVRFPAFEQIRRPVKVFIAGFIVFLIALPYCLNQLAIVCLYEEKTGLKVINLIAPNVTDINIANAIIAVRPKEHLAQEFMLRTTEYYLSDESSRNLTKSERHVLLKEALVLFDKVRSITANNPNTGVREVALLMANHAMLDGNTAYTKAHQVLDENLKANPYHVNSMIALARLQVAEGNRVAALATLRNGRQHVLTRRDQQHLTVETLRQLAAPKVIAELDDIEKQLQSVLSESERGFRPILQSDFYTKIDVRLKEIEKQI